MLVINKKISLITIISLLIVIALSFLTLNHNKLSIAKEDAFQYLMSMNLGFSNRVNLVDAGE